MNKDTAFQGGSAGSGACPRCGRTFTCGMRAGQDNCWCAELPAVVVPDPAGAACYCPDCLRALIADRRHPA